MLQILMARVFILWFSRSFILRTKSGMIRQMMAQAAISSPNWWSSRWQATMRSSFSHSSSLSPQKQPRMVCICVQMVLSIATSKLRNARICPSASSTSSLWMNLLHLAIIWLILGGQISFILLAISMQLSATFSQFSSTTCRLGVSLWKMATARYWVSLVTFLVKDSIHLIACFRCSSSVESIELVEELVDSEKAGRDVHLCSSLAECVFAMFWNFCCILWFFKFYYQSYRTYHHPVTAPTPTHNFFHSLTRCSSSSHSLNSCLDFGGERTTCRQQVNLFQGSWQGRGRSALLKAMRQALLRRSPSLLSEHPSQALFLLSLGSS